ncbi:hypothetical protein [Sphingobacterium sp. LRF_L2]|uniref:hypothetical protein n=1 Tax=Sphingobacterium sp. LRF_L2 TaxID=3369421 RepID=UPI003F5D8BA1
MTQIFRYRVFTMFMVTFSLSSCLKDESTVPIVIIDPSPWYSYSSVWNEVAQKKGDNEFISIENSNTFSLSWDYVDSTKSTIIGKYTYIPTNFFYKIDTTGHFLAKNNSMFFIRASTYKLDTIATFLYRIENNTLTLRDTSVSPNMEITYKAENN